MLLFGIFGFIFKANQVATLVKSFGDLASGSASFGPTYILVGSSERQQVRSFDGPLRHQKPLSHAKFAHATCVSVPAYASPSAVFVNQWGPWTRHDHSGRSICQTGKPDTGRHCAPFSGSKRWHCPSHSRRTSFNPHPSPAHCRPSSLKGGFVTTSHFVSLTW